MDHHNPVDDGNQNHCLFYLDTNGLCAYISDHCCRMMGYAREELIAHTLDELGVLKICQCSLTLFELCMHAQTSRVEAIVRCKDGATYPAEICIMRAPLGRRMLIRCELQGIGG